MDRRTCGPSYDMEIKEMALRLPVPGAAMTAALMAASAIVTAGGLGAAAAPVPVRWCTVTGTEGDDVLRGTPNPDFICGFGGDDVLVGAGGNDVLRGGPGDDTLRGGAGHDRLYGGRWQDTLFGGPGGDVLYAGAGDDDVDGGRGNDEVHVSGDSPGFTDHVNCGAGLYDSSAADRADLLNDDCEYTSDGP